MTATKSAYGFLFFKDYMFKLEQSAFPSYSKSRQEITESGFVGGSLLIQVIEESICLAKLCQMDNTI